MCVCASIQAPVRFGLVQRKIIASDCARFRPISSTNRHFLKRLFVVWNPRFLNLNKTRPVKHTAKKIVTFCSLLSLILDQQPALFPSLYSKTTFLMNKTNDWFVLAMVAVCPWLPQSNNTRANSCEIRNVFISCCGQTGTKNNFHIHSKRQTFSLLLNSICSSFAFMVFFSNWC